MIPGSCVDANVGYKIAGAFRSEAALAALLGLPLQRVTVVPRGTPADPVLLGLARQLGVAIVSNDRFRDWAEAHPAAGETGGLIRGGLCDRALWLTI